jgi:hypothetical protein
MDLDWDENDTEIESESPFRTALAAGRVDEARSLIERRAADPETPGWLVTSMLEDLGLWLAQARRYDEAISAFERALGLGWDVVPDGRLRDRPGVAARRPPPGGRHHVGRAARS